MNGFTVSDLKLQYIAGGKIKTIEIPFKLIGDKDLPKIDPKTFSGKDQSSIYINIYSHIHPAFKLKEIQVPLGELIINFKNAPLQRQSCRPGTKKIIPAGYILPSAHAIRF